MERGVVKWFDEAKKFGFITSTISKKDIFVHATNIETLDRVLEPGDVVEYEIGEGAKGPEAKNVRLIVE